MIGRGQNNHIQLQNTQVSQDHARIFYTDNQFTLEDLDSINGTTVNSRSIDRHILADGDRIVIGGLIIEFNYTDTHILVNGFNMSWQEYELSVANIDVNRKEVGQKLTAAILSALRLTSHSFVVGNDDFDIYEIDTRLSINDTSLLSTTYLAYVSTQYLRKQHLDELLTLIRTHSELSSAPVVLILPVDNISDKLKNNSDVSRFAQQHTMDLVLLGYHELLSVMLAQNPLNALKELIIQNIQLRSSLLELSYTVTGPTPSALFFGRNQEIKQIGESIAVSSFAIIGGRRIGKTSLLHRLRDNQYIRKQFQLVYQDCSLFNTISDFLSESLPLSQNHMGGKITYGSLLDNELDKLAVVLLLDEIDLLIAEDSANEWKLFSALRALTNSNRLRIVFCGERVLRNAVRDPNSPLFNFATPVLLQTLDYSSVAELVTRPMRQLNIELVNEQKLVDKIYYYTAGHPSIVQRLCKRILDQAGAENIRAVSPQLVEQIIQNRDFQRLDFLDTLWERAEPLEKIISLLFVKYDHLQRQKGIEEVLKVEYDLDVTSAEVMESIDNLIEIRSILVATAQGYTLNIQGFREILSSAITIDDMLRVQCDEYQRYSED